MPEPQKKQNTTKQKNESCKLGSSESNSDPRIASGKRDFFRLVKIWAKLTELPILE